MIEFKDGAIYIGPLLAFTIGIVVLFIGKRINDSVGFLREFSIPEPVTGGLLFSVITALIYALGDVAINFKLEARDFLLVYFFTTIGINASLKDLVAGGKPLIILLIITIVYMALKNLLGISVAHLFDLSAAVGMLGGTVSLSGVHGTAISWAPEFSEHYGVGNARAGGGACATWGLMRASVRGGPSARCLVGGCRLRAES